MDPRDLLDSFRQNYFLGNYSKLLEKWNLTDDSNFGQYIIEINMMVARSIMCQKILQPKIQITFTKQPSPQLLALTEIVNKYLSVVLNPPESASLQEEENTYKQMSIIYKDIYQQNISSIPHLLIGCYIALPANDINFFTTNEQKFKDNFELLYLNILHLLRNSRLDVADTKLIELKKLNDDDILTLLATIHILVNFLPKLSYFYILYKTIFIKYIQFQMFSQEDIQFLQNKYMIISYIANKNLTNFNEENKYQQIHLYFQFGSKYIEQMAKEKYSDAVKYIDEVKERYGDSTKMINMKISCLMLMEKWQEAYILTEKLFTAMSSKQELFDTKELEVCLSNFIILSEICDKQNPDNYKILAQVNENALLIRKFAELNQNFRDMSQKLSVK